MDIANDSSGVAVAEGSGRPAGMPWISPYLMVKDAAASLAFYEAAFGFETLNASPGPDGSIMHAKVGWRDGLFMIGPEGAYGGAALSPATRGIASPVALYVYCEDVDALCERARAAGAVVEFPPTDTFWGDRLCKLTDLDGHDWNFATNHRGLLDASPPE